MLISAFDIFFFALLAYFSHVKQYRQYIKGIRQTTVKSKPNNPKLQKSENHYKYLMEMTSTISLQKFLVSSHCDSESVYYFIAIFFCSFQNAQIFFMQVLYFSLYYQARDIGF